MSYLLAFGSTHKALKAESVLRKAEIAFRLMPAPRSLSSYCDLMLEVEDDKLLAAATERLAEEEVGAAAIYIKENDGYVKV